MRHCVRILVWAPFFGPFLASAQGWAQSPTPEPTAPSGASCEPPATCVPPEDLKDMVTALKIQKCLQTEQPKFELDRIDIVTDKDGRVFVSGAQPRPYTLKMTWCTFEATGTGDVEVYAAKLVEEDWGWDFRLKFAPGYLPATAYLSEDAKAGFDLGLLAEPFHVYWANINAYVGFRSFGGGIGFDLTSNLGLYLGYALTWGTWQHNPHAALSFDLW